MISCEIETLAAINVVKIITLMSGYIRKWLKWHWLSFISSVFGQCSTDYLYTDYTIIDNCTFIETETGAIFNTGEPYVDNMRKEFIYSDFSRVSDFLIYKR